jgi:hypothetical protein
VVANAVLTAPERARETTLSSATLARVIQGALLDDYAHLLLETSGAAPQLLEARRVAGTPHLHGDAVLLGEDELEAHLAFLEFTGVTRALFEIRTLEHGALELRTLEW